MKLFLPLFMLSSFATSCAFHSGSMTGNASFADNNFTIEKTAVGKATSLKVLGIGGFGSDALVLEAKRDLEQNFLLQKGQALANVTVNFKYGFYFLFDKTTAVVSADIVSFGNSTQSPEKREAFFQKGDEVFVRLDGRFENAWILDKNFTGGYDLFFYRKGERAKFQPIGPTVPIFRASLTPDEAKSQGFTIGQKLSTKQDFSTQGPAGIIRILQAETEVVIIGISPNYLLISELENPQRRGMITKASVGN